MATIMFDNSLGDLPDLTPRQRAALRRSGLLTPAEILLPIRSDVIKALAPLSQHDAEALIDAVTRSVVPVPRPLVRRLPRDQKDASASGGDALGSFVEDDEDAPLRFGDDVIDGLLGGGIRRGEITEIVGESSSGKSQLCLSLAISSQLPSLGGPSTPSPPPRSLGPVVYITTEGHIPSSRLRGLADGLLRRHPQPPPNDNLTADDLADHIYLFSVSDPEALEHALAYQVPALVERLNASAYNPVGPEQSSNIKGKSKAEPPPTPLSPLRLLILDSLAALTRATFDSGPSALSDRSVFLASVTDKLKSLATLHNLAVVVTNQVSDVMEEQQAIHHRKTKFFPPERLHRLDGGAESEDDEEDDEDEDADEDVNDAGSGPSSSLPSKRKRPPSTSTSSDPRRLVLTYNPQARWFNGSGRDLAKEAALGLVWANGVNSRLMLARTRRFVPFDAGLSGAEEERLLVRRCGLVFGPHARGGRRVEYVVGRDAIWGLKRMPALTQTVEMRVAQAEEIRAKVERRREEIRGGGGDDNDVEEDWGDDSWMEQLREDDLDLASSAAA